MLESPACGVPFSLCAHESRAATNGTRATAGAESHVPVVPSFLLYFLRILLRVLPESGEQPPPLEDTPGAGRQLAVGYCTSSPELEWYRRPVTDPDKAPGHHSLFASVQAVRLGRALIFHASSTVRATPSLITRPAVASVPFKAGERRRWRDGRELLEQEKISFVEPTSDGGFSASFFSKHSKKLNLGGVG